MPACRHEHRLRIKKVCRITPLMRIYQSQIGAQRRSGISHRWIRTECLQKRGL